MCDGNDSSAIGDFLKGKSVLVTGATGLVGKVLVWKLLQSCMGIDNIFLLIRQKRGKTSHQRFQELITKSRDLFTYCDKRLLDKLVVIDGDCTLPGLGLSDGDKLL